MASLPARAGPKPDVASERVDLRKANTNSYVAATFTLPAANRQAAASKLYVGRLQEVIVVPIGSQRCTLLSALWCWEMVEDEQLLGLWCVRACGQPLCRPPPD